MREQKINVTLSEIKAAFEWFSTAMTKDSFPAEFALLIYNNYNLLKLPYNQLVQGIYDEKLDPRYNEFCEKMRVLVMKYIDRDEQANPIFDENKQPVINEMRVEFDKASAELEKEYESLNTKIKNKNKDNSEFLAHKTVITICSMRIDEIPNGIPPYIVGLLVKPEVK